MYVQIFAQSDDNDDSTGKTSWVNTGETELPIQMLRTTAKHLGSPAWHLQIKASDWREAGTGVRGGEIRSTTYELEVEFTPTDIAQLVNLALNSGLMEVVPARKSSKHK